MPSQAASTAVLAAIFIIVSIEKSLVRVFLIPQEIIVL